MHSYYIRKDKNSIEALIIVKTYANNITNDNSVTCLIL